MKNQPTRAEIVIMAGGAATMVFSFLAFYRLNTPIGTVDQNAWDTGLFPIATYPALAGLISAGIVALRRFARVGFSARAGGFTWPQAHQLLGVLAGLIMGGYLITNAGGFDRGIGFWGMLAGTAALVVGGFMLTNERSGPRRLN